MAIFDNPQNAFDAGFASAQGVRDTIRRNAAFNALSKTYGPTAGDPALAQSLQNLQQSQQMDPLLVQQQQTSNATAANALDQTQRAQKIAQVHTALSGALTSLGTSLNGVDDPNQRLALFDQQVDQLAPLIGADPAQLKQQLSPYRSAVAAKGADALPEMQNELDGVLDAQLTPEEKVNLGIAQTKADIAKSQLATQQAKTATAVKNGGLTGAQLLAKQKAQASAVQNIGTYDQAVQNASDAADEAIAYIKDHPDSYGFVASGVMGHGAKDVAGTPANKLAALLGTVQSNVGFNALHDIKSGGGSLGSVSDSEEKLLQSTISSIDQGQDANTIIAHLMKIKATLAGGSNRLKAAYRNQFGENYDTNFQASADDGTGATADGGTKAAPSAGPPAGVDATTWQYMTPEEKALWQQ